MVQESSMLTHVLTMARYNVTPKPPPSRNIGTDTMVSFTFLDWTIFRVANLMLLASFSTIISRIHGILTRPRVMRCTLTHACRMDTTPTPSRGPTPTPTLRPTSQPSVPPPTATPTLRPTLHPSISFAPTSPSGMPSSEPTNDAQVWQCSNGNGQIDQICSELLSGDQQCLPGLTALLGRGLDITGLPDFSRAVKGRVYDFEDTPSTTSIGSNLFRAPDHSTMSVDAMEKTTKSVEYESSYFESFHSYQSKMSIALNLEGGLSSSPPSWIGKSSMMSVFLRGLGVRSGTATSIDSAAKAGAYQFVNKAAIEKARYSLIPSTHGETCSSNIFKKLRSLPQQYETNMKAYDQFVEEFGTHILTDVTLGGTIALQNSMEKCSITKVRSVD